jgi:hypothetical protein
VDLASYAAMMQEWADETDGIHEAFKSLFAGTTEGYMKYLFALHYMAVFECEKRNIPQGAFLQSIPMIVGHWYKAGKPEAEFLVVDADEMEAMMKHLKERLQGEAGKPSSDA